MKIKPCEGEIQLKFDEVRAGTLDMSSKPAAVEVAEVVAVGADIKTFKKGDLVMVKSWAIDHINHEGKMYHFVSIDTKGLKAVFTK